MGGLQIIEEARLEFADDCPLLQGPLWVGSGLRETSAIGQEQWDGTLLPNRHGSLDHILCRRLKMLLPLRSRLTLQTTLRLFPLSGKHELLSVF